ncbi:MAG: heme-copper oxidase subunit III [Actinobacteria bacterium]|nr:heme-copper oxidase subunit III [Actinomycetota bacterium]
MTSTSETVASNRAEARSTGQFGVIVFLASDVMLFAAFFAAYFLLRSTNSPWPAEGAEIDVSRALVFTIVLFSSSFSMIATDRAQERGDRRWMKRWLMLTILLGGAFLANQILEYTTLNFRADDSPYGSVYWGLTGLHTMHVTGGLILLSLLLIRTTRTRHLNYVHPWAAGASLFWHLVDVLWLAVFTTIWIIQ